MECVLQPCIDEEGEPINLSKRRIDRIMQSSEIRRDGVKAKYQDTVVIREHIQCRVTIHVMLNNPQYIRMSLQDYNHVLICF